MRGPVWLMRQVYVAAEADDRSIGHRLFQNGLIGGVGLFHVRPVGAGNVPEAHVAVHRRFFFHFALRERGSGPGGYHRERADDCKNPTQVSLHPCCSSSVFRDCVALRNLHSQRSKCQRGYGSARFSRRGPQRNFTDRTPPGHSSNPPPATDETTVRRLPVAPTAAPLHKPETSARAAPPRKSPNLHLAHDSRPPRSGRCKRAPTRSRR